MKPAPSVVKKKPAAVKKPAQPAKPTPVFTSPAITTIVAAIDVGFGNSLYLRGEGPGLSWDSGVPARCLAGNLWSFEITGATQQVTFKFLLNDSLWSAGDDFVVAPGASVTLDPQF